MFFLTISLASAFGPSPPPTPSPASWCPQSNARPGADVSALIKAIDNEPFSAGRLQVLLQALGTSSLGYDAQGVVDIIDAFTFSGEKADALQSLQPYVLGLIAVEEATVIESIAFSSDKMDVLRATCSFVLDARVNNATILDAFSFSSDKKEALKIIQTCAPRSCVYGDITAKKVHFVVDTSGSMAGTFDLNGATTNRLEYAQLQLLGVINEQLPQLTGRMFNLFQYSASVSTWQPGLQPATATNLASAVKYVDAWHAGGGTSTYAALKTAYGDPDVEAVYLLSDGMPNDESAATILAAAISWSKGKTIPLHTVALVEGGSESPSEKEAAMTFMKQLADGTGGIYRGFGP